MHIKRCRNHLTTCPPQRNFRFWVLGGRDQGGKASHASSPSAKAYGVGGFWSENWSTSLMGGGERRAVTIFESALRIIPGLTGHNGMIVMPSLSWDHYVTSSSHKHRNVIKQRFSHNPSPRPLTLTIVSARTPEASGNVLKGSRWWKSRIQWSS